MTRQPLPQCRHLIVLLRENGHFCDDCHQEFRPAEDTTAPYRSCGWSEKDQGNVYQMDDVEAEKCDECQEFPRKEAKIVGDYDVYDLAYIFKAGREWKLGLLDYLETYVPTYDYNKNILQALRRKLIQP